MEPITSIDAQIKKLRAERRKYTREYIKKSRLISNAFFFINTINKVLDIIGGFSARKETKDLTKTNNYRTEYKPEENTTLYKTEEYKPVFPFWKKAAITGGCSFLAGAVIGWFKREKHHDVKGYTISGCR